MLTFAFSKSVCSFFLRLWGDILFSFALMKAFLIRLDIDVLWSRLASLCCHVLKSGLSLVTISGFMSVVPFCLSSM